jgi:hypothetical protein
MNYGLSAAYSVPVTRPDFGTPLIYLPQANGRWYIQWQNPDGTTTGGYQNTNLTMDPHFVAPPQSVWDSLGVMPDYLANPAKLTGNIQQSDFDALHPFNPASVGSAATAPSTGASSTSAAVAAGAPNITGLVPDGSPVTSSGVQIGGTSIPWLWLAAGGAALWFMFGRSK